jgi:hypothetical protein
MTEAELTITEIKAKMEKCKALYVEVGELMDGHTAGVGSIVLAKALATIACVGGIPKETLIELVSDEFDAVEDGLKEEGLSSLH